MRKSWFRTTAAAERAASDGCPKCGGVDIDLDVPGPACRHCDHRVDEHQADGCLVPACGCLATPPA
jgi:hypothetical protein